MKAMIRRGLQRAGRLPLSLRQAVKFGLVGVSNTAVDWLVYFLLTAGLHAWMIHPTLAKGISYSAGILNSFVWNRNWTFRSKSRAAVTFFPFLAVNLIGLAINTGLMQLGLFGFGLPEVVSLGLATAGTLAWNFVFSKFLIFRS